MKLHCAEHQHLHGSDHGDMELIFDAHIDFMPQSTVPSSVVFVIRKRLEHPQSIRSLADLRDRGIHFQAVSFLQKY